jgi:Big-like domain-containing protein
MSLASRPLSTALLVLVLAGLFVVAGLSTASAQAPTATASAQRAAAICAKWGQAAASTSGVSATRHRRAATRRCLASFSRSTTKRRSKDTTAPSVSWQAPTAGAAVKGMIEGSGCEASASDERGVERIVMKVDGTTLNTEVAAPYNCAFDSTKVSDGSHTLTATAYDAAGNSRTASTTVNVSNAPAPESVPLPSSGSLVIGVDGGYADWSGTETTYRTQLGAAVTRHEWDPTQPVNAQDALVLKAASQVHTRIHALLGANELGDAIHYREWVVAFIRRYGVGGSFWAEHPELDASRYAMTTFELGNEPYFGGMSASLYADTVRPTLEEVKRLGLQAKIVLPSRVYGTDTSWMDALYQRIPGLNSLFYAFADHPYWYGHDPAQVSPAGPFGRIAALRRRMNEQGASTKPIFISEYGESTASCGSECVTEAVQAEHLQEMLNAPIAHPEWKIEMVSVFQLLDRGTGSANRELQFGLLRQNGTPKPSYAIVRGAMQQYRG